VREVKVFQAQNAVGLNLGSGRAIAAPLNAPQPPNSGQAYEAVQSVSRPI
jgi:hypothetical protein